MKTYGVGIKAGSEVEEIEERATRVNVEGPPGYIEFIREDEDGGWEEVATFTRGAVLYWRELHAS